VAEAKRLHLLYHLEALLVDPSAAGLIAEMRAEGLPVREADNVVRDGIQRVKARWANAGDGHPRLTISPSCVNTAAEAESYTWKENNAGIKDEPEKVNDHAMDSLRYMVNYIDRGIAKMSASINPFYS
jgi:phage terminase large subunit